MKLFNAGEVWEWADEAWLLYGEDPQLFLVVRGDFAPNEHAKEMLNLETGEVEVNFPEYDMNPWTRVV